MLIQRHVLSVVTIAALASMAHAQPQLFGINSEGEIASIDLATGQATVLFDAADFGGSLAFDPGTGLLSLLTSDTEPGSVVQIDPVAMTASAPMPITGLPAGQRKTGGIGYSGVSGQLLVTYGPTGTFNENKLARLNTAAAVTAASDDLGLGDNDGVVWDDFNKRLIVHDYNASDGFPRVAELSDPFGTPSFTAIGNPPSNNNVGDSAVNPDTGRLYVSGFDSGGGSLIEVVGDTYVTVGAYNAGPQITGIAFVYATPCVGDIADDFGALNPDNQISFGDFLAMLTLLGPCPGNAPGCTGDIADDLGFAGPDGQVSFGDFLALLSLLGPCP